MPKLKDVLLFIVGAVILILVITSAAELIARLSGVDGEGPKSGIRLALIILFLVTGMLARGIAAKRDR